MPRSRLWERGHEHRGLPVAGGDRWGPRGVRPRHLGMGPTSIVHQSRYSNRNVTGVPPRGNTDSASARRGGRRSEPLAPHSLQRVEPALLPGRAMDAYESYESGATEIYLARTDAAGDRRRLSPAGGEKPRWRADGRELYYIGPAGLVMAVPVSPGAQLTAGDPVPLFQVEDIEDFDVTADGSRFLVSAPAEKSVELPICVIVNWTSLLRDKGDLR